MKNLTIIASALLTASFANAQVNDGFFEEPVSNYRYNENTTNGNDREGIMQGVAPKDNLYKPPMPYAYLREADVMWSRVVWRKLDMREKMNQPIYYPLQATKERISLVQLILNAMKEGSLTVYDVMNDEFTTPLSYSSTKNFGSWTDTIWVENPDTYVMEPKPVVYDFDPATVKEFRIKEVWFFDKQRSQLDVRILGICPVAENLDPVTGEVRGMSPMFWVYFPELRNLLSSVRVFTRFNGSTEMTYDDLFWKRMFSSYIYKVSNVYDRKIADYTTGINALLESEKAKDDIFVFEHDLWEY